ncbi:MAG: TonB family protein [Bacteroidaceae bacterium]|nr:TonB family protein [Bacteroidaceae bacterium]
MRKTILCLMAMMGVLTLSAQSVYENEVINTIMARRSVRKYLDKPVEHKKLEAIVRCGINAPSAMNRQPWIIRVVEDQKLIADVTEVYKRENAEQVARDKDFKNMFRNAPNLICVCTPANGGGELDAGLLGENMMLTAQSLGLGTCCLQGPVRFLLTNEKAKFFLDRLDIPADYRLLYIIAVGYPNEKPDARPRDASKVKYITGNAEKQNDGNDRIFVDYEENALFPGGEKACMKWLAEHIKYPKDCLKKKIEGRVTVSFIIKEDGYVTDVKAIKSPHPSLAKEAVRVVSEMPRWKPARNHNKTIRSRVNLPIIFKIPQNTTKKPKK